MKKSIITIILFCGSIGANLKAQTTSTASTGDLRHLELGFRLMPTFSAFDMQTSSGGTIKGEVTLGYGIGGMIAFNFTNHMGIQGEVIYNSLSQKYVDEGLERRIKVNYVNIPLMFSLNTNKTKMVNLNAVLGPQLGLNIGSSVSSSSDTLTTVLKVKKSDFGFAYGAGVEIALNDLRTVRLDMGFRGVYGLINISNTQDPSETGSYYILKQANVRTSSVYLGLSLLF